MSRIYEQLDGYAIEPLPRDLCNSFSRPLVLSPDGAVVFAGHETPMADWAFTAPETLSGVERWCNDVLLDSDRPAEDPLWGPQLLIWGLVAATDLLHRATPLAGGHPVQALIQVQSKSILDDDEDEEPNEPEARSLLDRVVRLVRPEPEFTSMPLGKVKLWCVREMANDLSAEIREDTTETGFWAQPRLVVTARP